MSDKFKNMTLGKGVLGARGGDANLIREFSEETQNYIDEEIARVMEERYKYVLKLLSDHKDLLDYIANRLVEVETMDGKEFYEIVKGEQHCRELEESAVEAISEKPAEETSSDSPSAEAPSAENPASLS